MNNKYLCEVHMTNKLKEVRFFAKKSQDQLHIETGLSQSKICRIENGFIQPSREEQRIIARVLRKSIKEIFPKK